MKILLEPDTAGSTLKYAYRVVSINITVRRGLMPKQITEEEQIELILGTIALGKRSEVKKNLIYLKTELGGCFVAVENKEEDNA